MTGCTSQRQLIGEQATTIEMLRARTEILERNRDALRDSLHFYAGVRSGQYLRDMRTLRDSVNLLSYRLAVYRDGGAGVATFHADDLFTPADIVLKTSGKKRLDSLAKVLQDTYPERSFRVEGFADNTALGPRLKKRFAGNWELSAARAGAVARYLSTASGMPSERFVIVGYGTAHPVARNDTDAGRRLNRRVHIAVIPDIIHPE